MEKNSKKSKKYNNIPLQLLIIFLWLVLVGSFSYAFFSISFNRNKEKVNSNIETGLLDIDFETSATINNTNVWPILDSDIYDKADVSKFSVKRNENSTVDDVYYTILLDEIELTDNLKSPYVKWALYDEDEVTQESVPIGYGSFENINDATTMLIVPNKITLPENEEHQYTLFIWLSNNEDELQNELLNGSLSCKVQILASTN